MTKLTQYVEAFWGADFISTAGYEALSKHNSEEKKFLQDFEEYLRKRSKMEAEYSKALGQLFRSLKDRPVVGVLETAWNTLRGELDTCKQAHEDAGNFFSQHADDTKRFYKDISSRRDMVEDRIKKIQSQKASQFKIVSSLCKTYRQKCREKDQAKDQYDILRREVTSTVKELDKARSKKDKTDEEASKADGSYKNSIFALEDIRQEWEKEMEWACKEFQDSDEEQIGFLRSEMWMAANQVSQTAVDVDESCERLRLVLETCEVNVDIGNFITHSGTGTERPAPVVYQNYYEVGSGSSTPRGGSASSLESQQQRSAAPVPSLGNPGSSAFYTLAHNEDLDPTYSTADPTYSMADPLPEYAMRQLTISKSFQTQDNFSVQAGERVTFMRKVNQNVVEVKTHLNRVGHIPLSCIKEPI